MRLVNSTFAPAQAIVATTDDRATRRGIVVAKLTVRIAPDGATTFEREQPQPILRADAEHELGVLPNDLHPVATDRCEVIVLGNAHAPGGRPATSQRVELAVGEHSAALDVYGDRSWHAGPTGWTASAPAPYRTMPLVWQRAFGGSSQVWLDAKSSIAVADDINPLGRGFDPRERARALGEVLYCAPGFPVVRPDDVLPNLEDPRAPVQRRGDAPEPICWATLPVESAVPLARWIRLAQAAGRPLPAEALAKVPRARCHPQWLIPTPPLGTMVELRGLTPEGRLRFALPTARPLLDYHVGTRQGTRELAPVRVLLLPEERRLHLLFATRFTTTAPQRGEPRSLRLRLVDATGALA